MLAPATLPPTSWKNIVFPRVKNMKYNSEIPSHDMKIEVPTYTANEKIKCAKILDFLTHVLSQITISNILLEQFCIT